jgi:hypothetical protein
VSAVQLSKSLCSVRACICGVEVAQSTHVHIAHMHVLNTAHTDLHFKIRKKKHRDHDTCTSKLLSAHNLQCMYARTVKIVPTSWHHSLCQSPSSISFISLTLEYPYHLLACRLEPAILPAAAAVTMLEGVWTGITVAAVPPGGEQLFGLYLTGGRCNPRYAIVRVSAVDGAACATRCVKTAECVFFSFGPSRGGGDCMLFSFCTAESAINYTTHRVHNPAGLVGTECSVELRVHGLAVTLAVHSCAGATQGTLGVRRSAQAGELHGVLLPASSRLADGLDGCDSFGGAAAMPCEALLPLPKTEGLPFEYWRVRVLWTRSSRDRASGDVDKLMFVMGLTDGAAEWPLQLYVLPSTAAEPKPGIAFQADGGVTAAKELPAQLAWRLRLQRAAAYPKPPGLEPSAIDLLAAANKCHTALAAALGLASLSPDCAAAVNAVLPDPAAIAGDHSSRAARAAKVCGNSCRPTLTTTVGEAASLCSTAWRSAPLQVALREGPHSDGSPVLLSGFPGVRELLSDLVRAADAVYLLAVVCASNWRGTSCAALEDNLRGCPHTTPLGSGRVARRTLLLSSQQPDSLDIGGDRVSICNSNCTNVLADHLFEEGCCAATVSAAELQWMDSVCRPAAIGTRFWVDWGQEAEPELFHAPDTCPVIESVNTGGATVAAVVLAATAFVDLKCKAEQCGLGEEDGAWPAACCDDSVCVNGGVKVAAAFHFD